VLKNTEVAGWWWLTPVTLTTQEAEIRRIEVQGQQGQIVHKTLSWKKPSQKTASGVAQGVSSEFKPQYCKKKKKKNPKTPVMVSGADLAGLQNSFLETYLNMP
jgi:hypothetical protein